MTPDKITQIFGFHINKRLRGKLQSVLEKIEHGHQVFRACGKNAVLRMYEKFPTFLRLEALSNNLKDFGLRKSLNNLDALRKTLAAVTRTDSPTSRRKPSTSMSIFHFPEPSATDSGWPCKGPRHQDTRHPNDPADGSASP
jgi:hypothetical protein